MAGDPTLYNIKHPIAEMMEGVSSTPPTGKAMTAARLAEIRESKIYQTGYWPKAPNRVIEELIDHIDAQAAEIAALKAEVATVRESALEEAAAACDAAQEQYHDRFISLPYEETLGRCCESSREQAAYHIAKSIRALKDQTP